MFLINYDGRSTVSIERACEIVGVARRTIYNWINNNKVDYLRTAGGSIRIIEETLFRKVDKDNVQ